MQVYVHLQNQKHIICAASIMLTVIMRINFATETQREINK
jgi:hypothetical protein